MKVNEPVTDKYAALVGFMAKVGMVTLPSAPVIPFGRSGLSKLHTFPIVYKSAA